MLNMLAHKQAQIPINPQHLAYCPTMDLVALATVDEKVQVYRLNGQNVFGVVSKQHGVKVNQIKWKPDGAKVNRIWNMRKDDDDVRPNTRGCLQQQLHSSYQLSYGEVILPDRLLHPLQFANMLHWLGCQLRRFATEIYGTNLG